MMPQGMRRFVSTPRQSNGESDSRVAAALPADLGEHALRREAVSAAPRTPLSSDRTGEPVVVRALGKTLLPLIRSLIRLKKFKYRQS
jgi:hypothetical protein